LSLLKLKQPTGVLDMTNEQYRQNNQMGYPSNIAYNK